MKAYIEELNRNYYEKIVKNKTIYQNCLRDQLQSWISKNKKLASENPSEKM